MNSSNHHEDEDEFTFFDTSETENQNQQDDLWFRLNSGELIYLGYPDDLCQQCYQREGFNYVRVGKSTFLVCEDCECRNIPLIA